MTRSDSIRHNARLIRLYVRGKSKAERKIIYDMLAAGPLGVMLSAIVALIEAQRPVTVKVDSFDAEFDRIQASIRSGARPHFDSRGG